MPTWAVVGLLFLLGLWVGSLATTAIERLPRLDPFQEYLFEHGEEPEVEVEPWMRVPFIFFFTENPFDHPLRWYDKVPLLPHFVYAWKFSNFKRLMVPAHCSTCRGRLGAINRIPVLSYLFQGGRCHGCRGKIPGANPLIELTGGLMFAGVGLWFGVSWLTPMVLSCMGLFLVATVVDWKLQVIPDELNLVGMALAVVYVCVTPLLLKAGWISDHAVIERLGNYNHIYSYYYPTQGLLGLLMGAGSLYAFGEIGGMMAGTHAMGGGDIKLAAWLGVLLGWRGIAVSLWYAVLIGAPCGILVLLLGKGNRVLGYTKFAFGPYICMGAGLTLFLGSNRMIAGYLEISGRIMGGMRDLLSWIG